MTAGIRELIGNHLSSSELYSAGCSVPSLPSARDSHVSFATATDHVVSCGGFNEHRCLTLDLASSSWAAGPVGHLTQQRARAAVVTNMLGTYVLGGEGEVAGTSSDFLPRLATVFEPGPQLPFRMESGCAANVNSTSFLIIAHYGG